MLMSLTSSILMLLNKVIFMNNDFNQDYLMHYGVLGMKWGVRRYQNKDGSLTPRGIKKLHKKYDKYVKLSRQRITSSDAINNRYLKSYNNAADRMNNGLTDKYNRDYAKKLGKKAKNHDYFNDDAYEEGYQKLFDKIFSEEWNKQLKNDISNDQYYKKVQSLVDMYGKESLSDMAKAAIKEYEEI